MAGKPIKRAKLGFVEQSAGKVRLESREGRGTTVRLLFPTTCEPVASTLLSASDRPAPTG